MAAISYYHLSPQAYDALAAAIGSDGAAAMDQKWFMLMIFFQLLGLWWAISVMYEKAESKRTRNHERGRGFFWKLFFCTILTQFNVVLSMIAPYLPGVN